MIEGRDQGARNRTWLTLPRWLALCALGLSTLILTALLRGTPEDTRWYLWHVVPGVAVVAFCTTTLGRRVGTTVLLTYAAVLPTLTLLVGFGLIDPWADGVRVQLFTVNPNLLGADLVAVTLAAMVVRRRLPWALWLPVVALAVVFTGSRAALLALGLAFVVWLVMAPLAWRSRIVAVTGLACFAGIVAFAQWQVTREDGLPNLLRVSTTFEHMNWLTFRDAEVAIARGVIEGPYAGTRGDRLQVTTGEHRLAIYQGIGRSIDGQPYVASVYLRADSPQEVVLSTHMSRTTCEVGPVWQRCVTPVGIGNGRSAAQFRFETLEPGAGFDVYAFGPQYEIAEAPSAYVERGATLLPPILVRRIAPASLGPDGSRLAAMRTAVDAWSHAPLLGTGPLLANAQGAPATTEPSDQRGRHAHNLLLERLASDGLLGLVGWVLIVLPLTAHAVVLAPRRLLPWLTALVVLNSLDVSLLHSGSYFSALIVVGVMYRWEPQTWVGR